MAELTKNLTLGEVKTQVKELVQERKQQAEKVLAAIKSVGKVQNDEHLGQANALFTVVRKQAKAIDNGRLEKTKPLRDELKEAKQECDSVTNILGECAKLLKAMIKEYRDEQLAAEQAEIEKAEKEAKRRSNISIGLGGDGTIKTPVKIPQRTFKDRDSTRTASVWAFEVTDKTKLPGEYLLVDNVAIRDKMRVAVKNETIQELEIPGVKFERKEQVRT